MEKIMSKIKITNADGEVVSTVPSIKGVKPAGSQVLVEVLTAQETLGTTIHLTDNDASAAGGAPQGYVKGVGPKVQTDIGFEVGNRVVLTGNFTPIPEFGDGHRPLILVDPHQIKAVLEE